MPGALACQGDVERRVRRAPGALCRLTLVLEVAEVVQLVSAIAVPQRGGGVSRGGATARRPERQRHQVASGERRFVSVTGIDVPAKSGGVGDRTGLSPAAPGWSWRCWRRAVARPRQTP